MISGVVPLIRISFPLEIILLVGNAAATCLIVLFSIPRKSTRETFSKVMTFSTKSFLIKCCTIYWLIVQKWPLSHGYSERQWPIVHGEDTKFIHHLSPNGS